MSVPVEAVPSELRACAVAAGSLAEQLGVAGLAGPVDLIPSALLGDALREYAGASVARWPF